MLQTSLKSATWMVLLVALGTNIKGLEKPTSSNIEYGKVDDISLLLDFYAPTQSRAERPLIIWVHGGAWRSGSKSDVPIVKLREQGFAIASVDYRLSPVAKFPAQIHDIKSAVRYLRANAERFGVDTDRFVLAGNSAGGHLAVLAAVSDGVVELSGGPATLDNVSSRVQAVVSFYGAGNIQTILSQSTPFGLDVRVPALKLFLGGLPDQEQNLAKLASPVEHIDGLDPPLWLIHGDQDPQMPINQSHELVGAYHKVALQVKLEVVHGGKHGGAGFFTEEQLRWIGNELLGSLKSVPKSIKSVTGVALASSTSVQSPAMSINQLLFDDRFETLRPGSLMPVVGPHSEYHYLSEAIPYGPWAVTAFDSGSDTQTAWRSVRLEDGSAALQQICRNKAKHWHPMVVAGDRMWQDYSVIAKLHVEEDKGRFGIAVRQRNDRCYYFVGIDGGQAVLIRVQHEVEFQVPGEERLAVATIEFAKGADLTVKVTVVGEQITAEIGNVKLQATDATFATGCVALLADVPVRYDDLQVMGSVDEVARLAKANSDWRTEEAAAASTQPSPKLWRKIMTPQFGTDRNLRFGDLNGDKQMDILIGQVFHHGPTDSNSELGCLTAIELDGKILWRLGTPDRWGNHLTNDVGFQVHDIDNDGKAEVIYCKGQELIVAEGATGKRLRAIPTPENTSTRIPFNRFPRVLGDSLMVADLRGLGFRSDIVLKDRYQKAWAFDDQLKPLWTIECNTGHFPFPMDTNADGREEISLGYSRWSPDGKLLWSHDQLFKDHVDSVAVIDLDRDGTLETIMGCSDEGFIMLDGAGVPRLHLRLGHVQNLTVAELRPDLPGLEIATANFWKNQGLIHILDAKGNVVADFEPRPEHGSSIVPVNWKGDGSELILIGPDSIDGGLFDGFGHKAVRLPSDGHPTKAYDALDLTGDNRDELIFWDSQEIWIYTQSNPAEKNLPAPIRNSLSNESNYRARVSVPAPAVELKTR